jgi:hypothetical protein
MAAPKGNPRYGGRQKGTRNRLTRDLKAMILGALSAAGGQAWFEHQMEANPVAFMALLGRLLPLTIGSEKEKPLEVKMTREERAEQTRQEIRESFREWKPSGDKESSTWPWLDKPVIEQRSSLAQDGDRSEPVAEADRPALPIPREFAAPGSLEIVRTVAGLPASRYRPTRPARSGWAG